MRICVIDVETTGPDPMSDRVCELGVVELNEALEEQAIWSCFVNPEMQIPPQASAIHHIVDSDVESAIDIGEACLSISGPGHPDIDYAVSHNASFETPLLPVITAPWICTLKCALTLWPEAPAHNLQTLRYWRELVEIPGVDREAGGHRALPDALVCAALLRELNETLSLTEVAEISAHPVFLHKFGFGKHEGQPTEDIPTGYLRWMLGQDFDENVMFTARTLVDRSR